MRAADGIRRIPGVADGAQGRLVQQRPVVEMKDEDRRVRRDRVDLLQRRQPALGELQLGEAADDAHPLRRRRARDLRLEHRHGVGQRADAVPAQFEVVVEPAADDVDVAVAHARDHPPAASVDDPRLRAGQGHDLGVAADLDDAALCDREGRSLGLGRIQRGEPAVVQDQLRCRHASSLSSRRAVGQESGRTQRRARQQPAPARSGRHRSPSSPSSPCRPSLPGEIAAHQVAVVRDVVGQQVAQALHVVAPVDAAARRRRRTSSSSRHLPAACASVRRCGCSDRRCPRRRRRRTPRSRPRSPTAPRRRRRHRSPRRRGSAACGRWP